MKYLWFIFIFLISGFVRAQGCQVQYSGSLCQNSTIVFTGEAAGTTHFFDFNGENTASGNRIVSYHFKTTGTKQITYITTINSTKCTSTVSLVIKAAPRIILTKRSSDTQCYENNLFCFDDSTYGPGGAKIKEIVYNTNYGMRFEYKNPVIGESRCFSFVDQRGGELILYVTATDENGCITNDTFENMGVVHPKIGARFSATSVKNPSCDSTIINFTNLSGIASGNVKTVSWIWGDGNTSDKWGPNLTYTYKKLGIFNASLVVIAKTGCKDSVTRAATATVFSSRIQITSTADSTCISNARVVFGVKESPVGITGFLWNFGDPASGPSNFNNRTFSPDHTFTGLGPFQIKLTVSHPVCGNLVALDTLLVLGPLSVMEAVGNRLPEYEVFQCMKDKQDSVHFKNFSRFYHNDANYFNDDSIRVVNGVWRHVFNSSQVSLKNAGYIESKNRGRGCAQRLWDFGDTYAPKCTTAKHLNQNVNGNCRYSVDSLPVHYYRSWDEVLWTTFKNAYFEEGIFDESSGSCGTMKVWPSDSFAIADDTLLAVPASSADVATANSPAYKSISSKYFLAEKWFLGVGSRFINNYVDIRIANGKSLEIVSAGGAKINLSGPATYALKPGHTINSYNSSDSVEFLLTQYLLRDTMPLPFLRHRQNKGQHFAIISQFVKTYSGVKGKDYIIDYNRFRQHYFSKIPAPFTAKLTHRDTCNSLGCESERTKLISMTNADAGGMGVGLRHQAIPCYLNNDPLYNVTFILSDLKPGESYAYAAINLDSNCSSQFIPYNNFMMGKTPPYTFYNNYNVNGNPSPYLNAQYLKSNVCGEDGCVTVGVIIGNGVSKSGAKPLCADTQYYQNMFCFPEIDPRFDLLGISPNSLGNYKICKGNPVAVSPVSDNATNPHDIKTIKWALQTANAGRNFANVWENFVLEEYHFNETLPDSVNTKRFNYLVISRGGNSPTAIPCNSNDQNNNSMLFSTPDTIITAVIHKWDTVAFADKVWDSTAAILRSMGFDPFAISPGMLAKMIWNGVGTIGLPNTGARGCLDTTGFGNLIKFELIPDRAFTKILHYRDTSIAPLDSVFVGGKWHRAYIFNPTFNGYHQASVNIISRSGVCAEYSGRAVLVGFAAGIELPDSVLALQSGETLSARADFRYFHPDPINFGTWDLQDYWRDFSRIGFPNKECFSKWDWSLRDDDPGNPQTIFSSGSYGATGIGSVSSPWKTLGGGPSSLYYKDTGVYILRLTSCDSSQCADTIARRIFVTGLDVKFGTNTTLPSCNSLVEFFDSTRLHDPCSWAMATCYGQPASCDFINFWAINWGDGRSTFYSRSGPADAGLPSVIAHKYTANGWFEIKYFVKTDKGSVDTFSRWIRIAGPRPKFAIDGTLNREITIQAGDSVKFNNLSDSASSSADWTWFFGDGSIENTKIKTSVSHTYTTPGVYHVFLQQYDSIVIGSGAGKFCPAVYPDTPLDYSYIIYVEPTNRVKSFNSGGVVYAYPNPTRGMLHIEGARIRKVVIYTSDGREVYKSDVKSNEVSVQALAPGIYMMKAIAVSGEEHLISVIREE